MTVKRFAEYTEGGREKQGVVEIYRQWKEDREGKAENVQQVARPLKTSSSVNDHRRRLTMKFRMTAATIKPNGMINIAPSREMMGHQPESSVADITMYVRMLHAVARPNVTTTDTRLNLAIDCRLACPGVKR